MKSTPRSARRDARGASPAARSATRLPDRGERATELEPIASGDAPARRPEPVDHWHVRVRKELGLVENQGKRYSPGYPSWPELADQRQLWNLLDPERTIGVSLTEAHRMVPEQSTSAVVLHHSEAIYHLVRGLQAG